MFGWRERFVLFEEWRTYREEEVQDDGVGLDFMRDMGWMPLYEDKKTKEPHRLRQEIMDELILVARHYLSSGLGPGVNNSELQGWDEQLADLEAILNHEAARLVQQLKDNGVGFCVLLRNGVDVNFTQNLADLEGLEELRLGQAEYDRLRRNWSALMDAWERRWAKESVRTRLGHFVADSNQWGSIKRVLLAI